jgi:CelD/BcsL family acetyltransferase involved in cellulose biosynthesis
MEEAMARTPVRMMPPRSTSAREADITGLRVAACRGRAAMLATCDELDTLARDGLEPNVFQESWMLAAAIRGYLPLDAFFAEVRDGGGALKGCFPFVRERVAGVARLRLWQPPQCFLCTPLLDREAAADVIDALLGWIERGDAPAACLDLREVRGDGPFATVLDDALHRRRWRTMRNDHQRAFFLPQAMPTDWLRKQEKERARLLRRMDKLGQVRFVELRSGDDAEPWIARFLALEAAGWKGERGTALGAGTGSGAFFIEIAREAYRRERLHMLALELDGKAIAMVCDLFAGDGCFAFKTTYDERHAKHSPGVLLETHFLCGLAQAHPATRWLDSCANPKQAGILRRWPQRCTVARYRTAPPWRFAGLQIIALQARRMLVSALRRHASAPSRIAPVAHDAAA